MGDTILNWVLRGVFLLFGAGAVIALFAWIGAALREKREKWAVRIGFGMILLALVYAGGHAKLLMEREEIEEGRRRYARFGDPRAAELNRGDLRGWLLDCTGEDRNALARYGVRDNEVQRVYPLGEAGANLIGGGEKAEERDYTIERLYARRLREPRTLAESGELHPAGTDMQLTLCSDATREAWRLLQSSGRPGAVVVQDVTNGAVVAYTATGAPDQAPLGIMQYKIPGSVFKLALSAVWWDAGMGDVPIECPAQIQVGARAVRNYESHAYPRLESPRKMLVVSCNTAAIRMAMIARERLGVEAFENAYRSYGFLPYSDESPRDDPTPFWNTASDAWTRRMTPPPSRVRFRERFNAFEWAMLAIGQGPVDVTPIAVSRFLQAIGSGGVMLPPTLEADRLDDLPEEPRRVMKETTAVKLQRAMLQVVDSGTARAALPVLQGTGWDMGGKTGTADIRQGQRPDGWFAGLMFGPDGRAKYTIVVYLDQGGPGGRDPTRIAAGMTRFMALRGAQGGGGGGAAKPSRTALAPGRDGGR